MTTPISTWLAEITEFTLKRDTTDAHKTFASVDRGLRNLHEPDCAMTVEFWTPYGLWSGVGRRDYMAVVHGCSCGRATKLEGK